MHGKNQPNIGPIERVTSVVAGGLLLSLGLSHGKMLKAIFGLFGAEMLRRGITGKSVLYREIGLHTALPSEPEGKPSFWHGPNLAADAVVTIGKPRKEVYQFWRRLENLPAFMKHLHSVVQLDDKWSRWTLRPSGKHHSGVHWEAVITDELPNERLSWQSLSGFGIEQGGTVTFKDAPGDRGTEVLVELRYAPPAGVMGAAVAKLLGKDPEQELRQDLYRLRQILECNPHHHGRAAHRNEEFFSETERSVEDRRRKNRRNV